MKTDTQTAYSVLFRNEDGSLRGTIPGSTPECAIRAANALEGQEVFGFATIRVEPEPISGMRFVLREVGPKAEPVVLTASPQVDEGRGGTDWQVEFRNESERSQMLDDLCTANARSLFRALHPGESDDEIEYEQSHDVTMEAAARIKATTPQPQGDASGQVSGGGEWRPDVRLHEIACDLPSLFGRASLEGHEAGQRLAAEVQAKMNAALPPTQVSGDGEGEPAAPWKPINLLDTNTDELFWFLRGDTIDGPRSPQLGGYDSDEWDYYAPAVHPPIAALSPTQARPECRTCNDRGEVGGHVGQTPESFDYVTEPCPDCSKVAEPAPTADGGAAA